MAAKARGLALMAASGKKSAGRQDVSSAFCRAAQVSHTETVLHLLLCRGFCFQLGRLKLMLAGLYHYHIASFDDVFLSWTDSGE